jgi:hypothetical protein
MLKVQILTRCDHCKGQAYLPVGEAVDWQGNKYIQHQPCPQCEGSGSQPRWIDLKSFATLLRQASCPHTHISTLGGLHFDEGCVWDDIRDVCIDCGAELDSPTLGDFILDPDDAVIP